MRESADLRRHNLDERAGLKKPARFLAEIFR